MAGCGSRDDHESRPRSDISQAPRLRVIAAEVFAEDVCPYIRVTDDYGQLICSAVEILGGVSPSSVQDLVIRDLLSDVFDFLYEGRRVIMSGQCATASPLLRRAFESLSLMVACCFDPSDRRAVAFWCPDSQSRSSQDRQIFKGKLEGYPTTGVVRVTDAHPAGTLIASIFCFVSFANKHYLRY